MFLTVLKHQNWMPVTRPHGCCGLSAAGVINRNVNLNVAPDYLIAKTSLFLLIERNLLTFPKEPGLACSLFIAMHLLLPFLLRIFRASGPVSHVSAASLPQSLSLPSFLSLTPLPVLHSLPEKPSH